ncbi:MAG: DUF4238 domain-containing protein [Verrucomicrobiia bacterium]
MKPRSHKKQHFVPASYLKAWCDPSAPKGPKQEPYVWVFDKDGGNPRRKSPENIFHETDIYTIAMPDGERDLVLEHGLQQLETEFVRIRENTVSRRQPLNDAQRLWLCAFVAAAHERTPSWREHQRKQWEKPLRMMEDMMEWAKTATPAQKRGAASICAPPSRSAASLDYEQVKSIHREPLQQLMMPMIASAIPLLSKLDLAVFGTNDPIGFITSDNPCIWFDPEDYKRPPLYRGPALASKTTEITLPVSPQQCVCLNQHGLNGYFKATDELIDEFNRRTRFHACKSFIVCCNQTKPFWFDPGKDPDDSWDKLHPKKN